MAAVALPQLRVGLVGLGAIGGHVARTIAEGAQLPRCTLGAVLVQRPRAERPPPSELPSSALLTTKTDEFFAADWSLCVESAGQPWIREHGRQVLSSGRSLLVTSVGALTDDALHDELAGLAAESGGKLMIAAGAMPGMDWMSSASLEEVEEVSIEQRKRPEGWKGTPAEEVVDLDTLSEPSVIFEGPARSAASLYPKNANISAALALATLGLDRVVVRLVADPTVPGPVVRVVFRGQAGELNIEVKGQPLSQRTSRVVPLSVVKALRNLSSPVMVGV